MARFELTDEEWERIAPLLPSNDTRRRGRRWRDHRTVMNGILWVVRTGSPWRDLPERYGPFQTCQGRLTRWQRDGTWDRLLRALQREEDAQGSLVWVACSADSSVVRAHQHAAGARRKKGKLCRTDKNAKRSAAAEVA